LFFLEGLRIYRFNRKTKMKINAEFNQRVVVHAKELDWIASPMKGVDRRPLDRVGEEVARATSIVRYAPGSHFSPHVHTGGEEFIVLEGVFQDEHGDFPVGSYIRNPPQSSHTPGSEPGCVIFVKLWQFELEDRTHIRLRMDKMTPVALGNGVSITPLYKDEIEEIATYCLESDATLDLVTDKGAELLVLEGSIQESDDKLVEQSWLRVPMGSKISVKAGVDGAKIWLKSNHLARVEAQIARLTAATA